MVGIVRFGVSGVDRVPLRRAIKSHLKSLSLRYDPKQGFLDSEDMTLHRAHSIIGGILKQQESVEKARVVTITIQSFLVHVHMKTSTTRSI